MSLMTDIHPEQVLPPELNNQIAQPVAVQVLYLPPINRLNATEHQVRLWTESLLTRNKKVHRDCLAAVPDQQVLLSITVKIAVETHKLFIIHPFLGRPHKAVMKADDRVTLI